MNSYCITFNIMDTGEKIKIDYGCVPVELLSTDKNKNTYKSSVSNEKLTLTKKRFGAIGLLKKEKQVVFQYVFETNSEMLQAEREYISFCVKYICKRIPLRFRYKKALKNRAKKILEQN